VQNLHLAVLAFLAAVGCAVLFVAWWALIGWGVSVAVRAYRWGMRYAADDSRLDEPPDGPPLAALKRENAPA
jgi:hypothetical protein